MCKNLPGKENRNYLRNHISQVFNLRLQTITSFNFYFFFCFVRKQIISTLGHYHLLQYVTGSDGKESACSKEDLGLIPVFMRGKFHGQRSQVGYSP